MGSLKMAGKAPGAAALPESSCAYLLQELKMIWDEVGQDQSERERILGELEQECQEVYRSKVNSANMSRIQLHQALAESEAEFTNLLLSLGERSFPARQFMEVRTEIHRIASEIAGRLGNEAVAVDEEDLSLKRLQEFQSELQRLKREKSDRLCKVEEYKALVDNFAKVMVMEPSNILANQQTMNINDDILSKLNMTVQQLKEEDQYLVKSLTNLLLWRSVNHMGKLRYLQTSVNGMLGPGSLTLETIQQRAEVDEVCKKSHMDVPYQTEIERIMNLIMSSGYVDHDDLLKTMNEYIYKAKEETIMNFNLTNALTSTSSIHLCQDLQAAVECREHRIKLVWNRGLRIALPLLAMLKDYMFKLKEKEEKYRQQ
ncbi:hypothetical protein ACJX0J_019937, partial [Zea mays]